MVPTIQLHHRPGLSFGASELRNFHHELCDVARTCLDELPDYQCLTGQREEFSRLVIAVARDPQGKMLGFCSAYLLDTGDDIPLLHLGLTCVLPEARGLQLTHKLTLKVVVSHLLRHSWVKPVWISNVACVLSSLGNVGLHFEDVYPSPFLKSPSPQHRYLARLINQRYRWELLIDEQARFDEFKFVFEGSVKGTAFEKESGDKRFFHRQGWVNQFYQNLLDFERGDEVLQIGKISFLSYPKYLWRSLALRIQHGGYWSQDRRTHGTTASPHHRSLPSSAGVHSAALSDRGGLRDSAGQVHSTDLALGSRLANRHDGVGLSGSANG